MNKDSKIFISSHKSMEGVALKKFLLLHEYKNIVTHQGKEDLQDFFKVNRPDYVFLLGESSGGIKANIEKPATLMIQNIMTATEILNFSNIYGVKKLIYLASSCVYPKDINQRLSPEMIMSNCLEPTNSAYATAKIAGLELVKGIRKEFSKDFISCISANCYGPHDDFISEDAHVISSLFRKTFDAMKIKNDAVKVWGSGKPIRDFIFVDDLAEAMVFLMNNYDDDSPINISRGESITIREIAQKITKICGFKGNLVFDKSKPDGMKKKILNNKELRLLGWESGHSLDKGLKLTYDWLLKNPVLAEKV